MNASAPRGTTDRKRGWILESPPLLLLLACILLLFRRLVVGRVLGDGDLQGYFFPYWVAAARALRAGRLPLWNPYLFAGTPLLANSQAGVFYPLNWPLWLLSGSALEGLTRSLHVSVLLHLGIAGMTARGLARRLGAGRWGAALAGLLYAGGGFLGLHVEHLNQLQGLAWLPLALPVRARTPSERPPGFPATSSLLAFALILLAGHTQTAFIAAVGIGLFRLGEEVGNQLLAGGGRVRGLFSAGGRALLSLLPFGLSGLVAAIQLLPAFELARYSMRAGGLPWREAVSFSLVPWQAHQALLPPYLVSPLLPEGVAYLGLLGLLLAGGGAWRAWRTRAPRQLALVVVAVLGLLLALGAYNPFYLLAARLELPGVIQFRAPARYLALYALGAAVLAGWGLTALEEERLHVGLRWPRFLLPVLFLLVGGELLLAAEQMPHANATVARAYSDLRPATAHLVAAARDAEAAGQPPGRFLSISKTLFDAGDTIEMESIYGEGLSSEALWTYIVAAKDREVLAPNLPLAFAVPAADGYDGGLLPLAHYAAFSQLLLPGGTLDGRLRENLEAIPDERWLDLLDVQFLITDKVGDLWAEGVFYDRQFRPFLAEGAALELAWLPEGFAANGLSLLVAGEGWVEVFFGDGQSVAFDLSAPEVGTSQWLRWDASLPVARVIFGARGAGLALSGAALLDVRTDAFYPLVLSERFRLAHSGDVKIYEAVVASPRAFFAASGRCYPGTDDAIALEGLTQQALSSVSQVWLADCEPSEWALDTALVVDSSPAQLAVRRYHPERIELDVDSEAGGLIVLKDAWYPGWRVTLEPESGGIATEVEVLRANVLFRAVPVPPGAWRIVMTFQPVSLYTGAGITLLGLLALLGYRGRARSLGLT